MSAFGCCLRVERRRKTHLILLLKLRRANITVPNSHQQIFGGVLCIGIFPAFGCFDGCKGLKKKKKKEKKKLKIRTTTKKTWRRVSTFAKITENDPQSVQTGFISGSLFLNRNTDFFSLFFLAQSFQCERFQNLQLTLSEKERKGKRGRGTKKYEANQKKKHCTKPGQEHVQGLGSFGEKCCRGGVLVGSCVLQLLHK
jgi:hypothetical protein